MHNRGGQTVVAATNQPCLHIHGAGQGGNFYAAITGHVGYGLAASRGQIHE